MIIENDRENVFNHEVVTFLCHAFGVSKVVF